VSYPSYASNASRASGNLVVLNDLDVATDVAGSEALRARPNRRTSTGPTGSPGTHRYGEPIVSHDFVDVDYAGAARALGAEAWRIKEISEFEPALRQAIEVQGRPTVIEVLSSPIESPVIKPMSGTQRRASY